MNHADQAAQVDLNYDVFQRNLAIYLQEHRGTYALMRDGEVIDFLANPGDAYRLGMERFADRLFSIQEVTDEPIDLGFFSHVIGC